MRKSLLLFALAPCLALAACGGGSSVASAGSTPVVGTDVVITADKALTNAELAYNTLNAAADAAADSGKLSAKVAAIVHKLNDDITTALKAAHSATTVAEQDSQVAAAMTAIAELQTYFPETVTPKAN